MKRILILALCAGLVSAPNAFAKKDKEEKRARKEFNKLEKLVRKQEKTERKFQRQIEEARFRADPNINAVVETRRPRFDDDDNIRIRRRGPSDFAWDYSEARERHRRHVRRDRAWYRNNYKRFAIFAGGYYYWDRGYWYPAYGYDPVYSTYRYDEPIYGYNGLDPRQVIVNVQVELKRRGYYRNGAIDGLLGPMTRRALARYQRDRGLYVTRSIDGPTLAALGLT